MLRINPDDRPILLNGLVDLALPKQSIAQVEACGRVTGTNCHGNTELLDRFIQPTGVGQGVAQV